MGDNSLIEEYRCQDFYISLNVYKNYSSLTDDCIKEYEFVLENSRGRLISTSWNNVYAAFENIEMHFDKYSFPKNSYFRKLIEKVEDEIDL